MACYHVHVVTPHGLTSLNIAIGIDYTLVASSDSFDTHPVMFSVMAAFIQLVVVSNYTPRH